MIELIDISKSFDGGRTFVVREVSLRIETGETLVLLGSSGSGKTTTLKTINRLIEATAGRVRIDGEDVGAAGGAQLRRRIGYVFQDIGLFPKMTVAENIAITLRLEGVKRAARRARARELLELVDMPADEYAERLPRELSGGQQQRVGIARALAADPKHLLMDEPFGALDAVTRDRMQRELIDLKHRLGKTIVFVTHDLFEAVRLGDRIAVMHEGELQQVGSASELMNEPKTEFVRSLFASADGQARELIACRDEGAAA
jgi:osmoprotectant transport system ATP-binding protein